MEGSSTTAISSVATGAVEFIKYGVIPLYP